MTLSLPELFTALTAAGARLAIDAGRLRIDAPRGALTPELREALAAHRDAIREALGLPGDVPQPVTAPDPWDATEARAMIDRLLARREAAGWSDHPEVFRRQGELCDRVDAAWLANDLTGLRSAYWEALAAFPEPDPITIRTKPDGTREYIAIHDPFIEAYTRRTEEWANRPSRWPARRDTDCPF